MEGKTLKGKLGQWKKMQRITNRCSIHVCFPLPYFIILTEVRNKQDQHLFILALGRVHENE